MLNARKLSIFCLAVIHVVLIKGALAEQLTTGIIQEGTLSCTTYQLNPVGYFFVSQTGRGIRQEYAFASWRYDVDLDPANNNGTLYSNFTLYGNTNPSSPPDTFAGNLEPIKLELFPPIIGQTSQREFSTCQVANIMKPYYPGQGLPMLWNDGLVQVVQGRGFSGSVQYCLGSPGITKVGPGYSTRVSGYPVMDIFFVMRNPGTDAIPERRITLTMQTPNLYFKEAWTQGSQCEGGVTYFKGPTTEVVIHDRIEPGQDLMFKAQFDHLSSFEYIIAYNNAPVPDPPSPSSSSSSSGGNIDPPNSPGGGLSKGAAIAIGVLAAVFGVGLIAYALKRRKGARKDDPRGYQAL